MRKTQHDDCLTETTVRKLSLKELAQGVIDRHAIETELLEGGDLDTAPLPPIQETARQEVLAQLEANPSIQRAFVNRFEHDGTMVLTLAIRGVGTGELFIPADRFNQGSLDDYAALLGTFEGVE